MQGGVTQAQKPDEEKLEIINADTVRYSKNASGDVIKMIGNVHLRQGVAEMFCGEAEYWRDKRQTIVRNNVRVYDRNKSLFAEQVYYFGDRQLFQAIGRVLLKDSLRQVIAEQIAYDKNEDLVTAEKNVVIIDSINYIQITGALAKFDNANDYAWITGHPILTRRDTTGTDTLWITSLTMELFQGGAKAVVSDSVMIRQGKANASCGRAEFYRDRNEILLLQKPVAWQGGDQLSGEQIQLFIEKNKLVKAVVTGQALVTSRVDTVAWDHRVNTLTGQLITMYFEDDQLVQVTVENQATSYYYIYEDEEEKGMNKIIGDKISVFIRDQRIERILVESNPQLSSGTYFPPNLKPMILPGKIE
ncbi:MAG: hypothetical protein ONB13_05060 [candidate division KSB1 bacterium]|nr:hypothetical protein [candidate division KSB1 bacterium]MDZ7375971.1 hypothetical protein [candidate division KSB1 bacterium]